MTRIKERIDQAGVRTYIRQAILFCFVGFMNFVVDIGAYYTAYHWLHFNYLVAQAVSYPCGALNSYFLNRRLTFSERGALNLSEMMRFGLLNVISICVSMLALYFANHGLGVDLSYSKIAANMSALVVNFIGSKWWVFRKAPATSPVETSTEVKKLRFFQFKKKRARARELGR